MADIKLTKLNEVYLKVACEESTAAELSEFFTFTVPGSEWNPARRRGWDGKLRLFDRRSYKIYVGVLPYIQAFAKERGYTVSGYEQVANAFSLVEAKEFVTLLNIHSGGKPLQAHDYQIASLIYGIRDARMLLLSPTSSGKSFIQYTLFRYLTEFKNLKKGLLIVPTTHLVEQMVSDFKDYSSHNGYPVESKVHRIYEGHEKHSDKLLYVSTWQSLQDMPKEYFEQFEFVLGDEAHLFKASSLKFIMTSMINAQFRIGLTGTLDGSKCHKLVLEGLFGRVRSLVTTRQLMDREIVASLTAKVLFLRYEEELSKTILDQRYLDELDWILASVIRNKFIRNLTLSLEGNTLILYQFVEKHGEILRDMIERHLIGTDRHVYFICGKVETEVREEYRKIVETEKNAIIIASYGTFQLGVSIKHIHNVILASPSKSRIRVLQSIGRGLRLGEFKHHCTLFDIVDDFSVGKQTNTILDHFQERFKYYTEQKFDYKLYTIHMRGE